MHANLCVKPISDCGTGIFTSVFLPAGTLLTIFGGHVMRLEDEPVFPNGRHDLALQISDDFVFGTKYSDEIETVDSFNHSCEPNAGFRGQLFLTAMRDIAAGEQVTFDYAMVLNLETHRFECRCNSQSCRRIVTGKDWQRPELQSRYDGWFQWYLQDKINALRGRG
jgi:hypothetical protein